MSKEPSYWWHIPGHDKPPPLEEEAPVEPPERGWTQSDVLMMFLIAVVVLVLAGWVYTIGLRIIGVFL